MADNYDLVEFIRTMAVDRLTARPWRQALGLLQDGEPDPYDAPASDDAAVQAIVDGLPDAPLRHRQWQVYDNVEVREWPS